MNVLIIEKYEDFSSDSATAGPGGIICLHQPIFLHLFGFRAALKTNIVLFENAGDSSPSSPRNTGQCLFRG